MFTAIRTAIKSYFDADQAHAAYTTTSGQLAYSQAKQSWSDNYVVFLLGEANQDDCFRSVSGGLGAIDDMTVQFNCYASTAAGAEAIQSGFRSRYDGAKLTVTGFNTIRLQRILQVPALETGENEDDLWLAVIEFAFKIQQE